MDKDERIFNYRLSRARRIVENAFGILANRFRCLLRTLPQRVPTVISIVLACVCLHNLMRSRYPGPQNAVVDREDNHHNIIPGAWRETVDIPEVGNAGRRGNFATRDARDQRDYLKAYYNAPIGAVEWQDRMV